MMIHCGFQPFLSLSLSVSEELDFGEVERLQLRWGDDEIVFLFFFPFLETFFF